MNSCLQQLPKMSGDRMREAARVLSRHLKSKSQVLVPIANANLARPKKASVCSRTVELFRMYSFMPIHLSSSGIIKWPRGTSGGTCSLLSIFPVSGLAYLAHRRSEGLARPDPLDLQAARNQRAPRASRSAFSSSPPLVMSESVPLA